MSGYYPDGVTGHEYAIAGADREWTDTRRVSCGNGECAEYDVMVDAEVDLSSYGYDEWGVWTCPACGEDCEYEGTIEPDEPEYEPEYDDPRFSD